MWNDSNQMPLHIQFNNNLIFFDIQMQTHSKWKWKRNGKTENRINSICTRHKAQGTTHNTKQTNFITKSLFLHNTKAKLQSTDYACTYMKYNGMNCKYFDVRALVVVLMGFSPYFISFFLLPFFVLFAFIYFPPFFYYCYLPSLFTVRWWFPYIHSSVSCVSLVSFFYQSWSFRRSLSMANVKVWLFHQATRSE